MPCLSEATGDRGVIADPYTGLFWPMRIEKADVVVKEGLPVAKTFDWLTLTTAALDRSPGRRLGGLGCHEPDVHHRWRDVHLHCDCPTQR